MKDVFVHVGMQRTASTYLQGQVFPKLAGVRLVTPFQRVPENAGLIRILEDLVFANPAFYDVDGARAELSGLLATVGEPTVLFSWERLFGDMFANWPDNLTNADRLKALLPAARILLVIRRQDDLLESLYNKSLHLYHAQTIAGFLNWRDGGFHAVNPRSGRIGVDVRQYDLHRYVGHYLERFGAERVLVLPYEQLRRDRGRFLDRLCAFLGVPPVLPELGDRANRSYSLIASYLALALNRFVRVDRNYVGLIPNAPFHALLTRHADRSPTCRALANVSSHITLRRALEGLDRFVYLPVRFVDEAKRAEILRLHADSNRRLDEELDLGLRDYGYY